jgi:hypothetical protein
MRRALVQDSIPALTASSGVDGALWAILERGLRTDPNERWSSMHELGQYLAGWLVSRGIVDDVRGCSIATEWFQRSLPGKVGACIGLHDDTRPATTRHDSSTQTLPFPLVRKTGMKGPAIDGWALLRALARDTQGRRNLFGAHSSPN